MNYEKKRKRQAGRQGEGTESERSRSYRQGYYDGKHSLIEELIQAGILPPVTFALKQTTEAEIIKLYPPI